MQRYYSRGGIKISKKIAKKIVATLMVVTCIAGMAFSSNAASNAMTDTIVFTSTISTGYSSPKTKPSTATSNTVKITSYSFTNGSWPSGKSIALTAVKSTTNTTVGPTVYKYSTTYNAIEHASYTYNGSYSVKIEAVNNTGRYGNINLKWDPDYVTSL